MVRGWVRVVDMDDLFWYPLAGQINHWVHENFPATTPNTLTSVSNVFKAITIVACVCSTGSVMWVIVAFVASFLAYLFDNCDGDYARKYNMMSPGGAVYDHLSDTVYGVVLAAIFLLSPVMPDWLLLCLAVMLYTTLTQRGCAAAATYEAGFSTGAVDVLPSDFPQYSFCPFRHPSPALQAFDAGVLNTLLCVCIAVFCAQQPRG